MHLMLALTGTTESVCYRCLSRGITGRARLSPAPPPQKHSFVTSAVVKNGQGGENGDSLATPPEQGAMSRRLEEMTEESLQEGGKRAVKAVEEAGFSEDLRKRLEQRIAEGNSGPSNSAASATLSMPAGAGQGTRDVAMARPWTGQESVEDASLRMLNDAHKPLRGAHPRRSVKPRMSSLSVDARMKQAVNKTSGQRLASARERTSIYAISQDPNLSEQEKDDMRRILKERFQPGARPMPTTIQGLASLANERIEDAIARGQFKNIPRGKGVSTEVDYNANSPFLNTTEYFMNKMIQRQDIVPPWIEKQQEVVKTSQAFRSRLRNDWKRHAARVIASRGGSLADQIRRAEAYAIAEAEANPRPDKAESISRIDSTGRLTQVTVVEVAKSTGKIQADSTISVIETPHDATEAATADDATIDVAVSREADGSDGEQPVPAMQDAQPLPKLAPFRDPAWESIELAYHGAALKELNNLTRSYNLMAPELAKRPYFSLERELASCFADVAPQLASEIKERARRPEKVRVDVIGHRQGSVLERLGGEQAKVYDSRKPNYGFKELLRELWNKNEDRRA